MMLKRQIYICFFDSSKLSESVGNFMLSWAEEHGM
jgi:hypothetical protein